MIKDPWLNFVRLLNEIPLSHIHNFSAKENHSVWSKVNVYHNFLNISDRGNCFLFFVILNSLLQSCPLFRKVVFRFESVLRNRYSIPKYGDAYVFDRKCNDTRLSGQQDAR